MSNTFRDRLYSLSIDNFFKYSFFYFYVFFIKNDFYRVYKEYNIKISYLHKFSNKKGQIFLFYNNSKTESFCLPRILNSLAKSKYDISPNLFYNSIFYNSLNYKNYTLKNIFINIFFLFNMKKIINYDYFLMNTYIKDFTILLFSKIQICNIIFKKRNTTNQFIV